MNGRLWASLGAFVSSVDLIEKLVVLFSRQGWTRTTV